MSTQRTFVEELAKCRDAKCVGCSYCCKKAPCTVAVRVYGPVKECPALFFEDGRWWCSLCRIQGPLGEGYRQELAIGDGCCSPLFNECRENIPQPVVQAVKPKLERQLRAFLHSMGRQGPFGPSGDLLWLVVYGAAKELGYGEDWIRACFAAIKEERSSQADEFMGEIAEEKCDVQRVGLR